MAVLVHVHVRCIAFNYIGFQIYAIQMRHRELWPQCARQPDFILPRPPEIHVEASEKWTPWYCSGVRIIWVPLYVYVQL